MNGNTKSDKSLPGKSPASGKGVEALLRQTKKALDALIQASPLAIIALDRDARVLMWSSAAEYLFGWKEEEVLNRPYPLVPESELAAFRKLIEEEFKGTRHTGVELKRRHKDGSLVDVTIWTTPLHDRGGHMYGVLGMLADNTERKRTEQQLRLQGAALNASANAVMITNTEGIIEWVNPAYTALTGYSPEEAIGKNPRQLVKSGKHDRAFYKKLWDTILAGNVWRSETINRRKDGSLYTEDQTIAPVRNERGEITHFVAIKQDISERKKAEEKLEMFRTLIDQANDAIEIIDPASGRFLDVNEKGCQLHGYSREEFLALRVADVDPRVDQSVFDKNIEELRQLEASTWESVHRRRDGSLFPVEVNLKYVHTASDDDRDYIVAIVRDISDRKLRDEKLRHLNRMYKVTSGINMLIVRTRNRQELLNEACRIAVEEGEFRMVWVGLLPPGETTVVPQACAGHEAGFLQHLNVSMDSADAGSSSPSCQALHRKQAIICNNLEDNDDFLWRQEAMARGYRSVAALPLIVEGNAIGVMAIYSSVPDFFDTEEMKLLDELAGDISYALQNLAQQEQLEFLASYDPLTGLPNRTLFTEHLDSVLNRARTNRRKVALLVCDLKQFTNINNIYGRDTGDMILRETASRLKALTSDPVNIGRITGDNFAMILHDVRDVAGIGYRFENSLFPALNRPFLINDNEIQTNFCGGIAIFPEDGTDAEAIYRNAEAAMKKAKAGNAQYLFYQPEMTETVAERLLLENKLRHALDKSQFVLHYQPKIDVGSQKITGLEALIRWNDPDTGLVPPGKFIPILEETGMILEVGTWAMEQALADARHWQAQGWTSPRIAVNVSSLQLQQDNFVDIVKEITQSPASPELLELEVTESLLIQDLEGNIVKLAALRDLGITIAIDDFGTGYSSLNYLARLPINALKIDRSFIMNMDQLPESMSIVSAIINLAHTFGLNVVAEGVETEEQAKFLRLLRCNEMQGFLFSKPLPAKETGELLRKGITL